MGNGSKPAMLVTRIVVHYRRPGEAEEHQVTLESTKGGGAITGIAWDTPLVEKIVYRENGKYVDPKRGQDPGNWKVIRGETVRSSETIGSTETDVAEATGSTETALTTEPTDSTVTTPDESMASGSGTAESASLSLTDSEPNSIDCLWVHNASCSWEQQCGDS